MVSSLPLLAPIPRPGCFCVDASLDRVTLNKTKRPDSVCVCVCECVVIPFVLDVRLVDVIPAGATQEEGHTGFIHLPSAVLALIFIARKFQPSLSLVDRKVEFRVSTS